jgi:hypothetical protein
VPVPGHGELFGACKVLSECVTPGADGAFVAAAPLCAHPRTFVFFILLFGGAINVHCGIHLRFFFALRAVLTAATVLRIASWSWHRNGISVNRAG